MIRSTLRARSLIPLIVLLSPFVALLLTRGAEPQAANEAQKMVLAEVQGNCTQCHKQFVGEWTSSRHAKSFTSMNYMKEAAKNPTRAEQCDGCHAPGLIHATGIGKMPGFRGAALQADRGVMCVCCHMDASGAMHGPHGGESGFHKIVKDPNYQKSNALCVSCHGQTIGVGADYDQITPFATYAQKSKGATCAECHMPAVERNASSDAPTKRLCGEHTWKGGYDVKEILPSAALLEVKLTGTTASVIVENLTGHRFPGGAWRQAILLILANGQPVKREVFMRTPGGSTDTRLNVAEKKPVTCTVPAGAKVSAQLWWKPMPDTPDNLAVKIAEAAP